MFLEERAAGNRNKKWKEREEKIIKFKMLERKCGWLSVVGREYETNKRTQVLYGRTDVEAETPILWPSDVKN